MIFLVSVLEFLFSDYSDKSVIVLSTKVYVIGFMLEAFSCNYLFLFSLVVTLQRNEESCDSSKVSYFNWSAM